MSTFNNSLQYINLESQRRNGEAIATPVWFVEHEGALYVRTAANSWKIKRIRNNPKVRIAPCRGDGKLTGDWVTATASEISDSAQLANTNQLLDKKYGLMKKIFELMAGFRKYTYTTIKIEQA